MKEERKNKKVIKNICFGAIFAALCTAATLISVPIPMGYINLGDLMVLTSGWCLGGIFGALAAGIGSALADILLGYVSYAPATFVIKALVALFAALLYKVFKKLCGARIIDFVPRFITALIAECIMVGGYFLFESLVMGYGLGAIASVPFNAIQGVVGALGASLIAGKIIFWTRINKD
jgi:uncharacterized membrane protein